MPSPPPPMGDPNAFYNEAFARKEQAESLRSFAGQSKVRAEAMKQSATAAFIELDVLRGQISTWCMENSQQIPEQVSFGYEVQYDKAVQDEQLGHMYFSAGVGRYNQGVSYYNSGLPLFIPYGYPMASQLFYSAGLEFLEADYSWAEASRVEGGNCAYAKYDLSCQNAVAARATLQAWFQTVNP